MKIIVTCIAKASLRYMRVWSLPSPLVAPQFNAQDPCGGRRNLSSEMCALTSTHVPWSGRLGNPGAAGSWVEEDLKPVCFLFSVSFAEKKAILDQAHSSWRRFTNKDGMSQKLRTHSMDYQDIWVQIKKLKFG